MDGRDGQDTGYADVDMFFTMCITTLSEGGLKVGNATKSILGDRKGR